MSSQAIHIQLRSTGTFVDATLLDGMAPQDLLVVESAWASDRSRIMQELLTSGVQRPLLPQSLHWDWRKKAPELKLLESSGFGVVCETKWQGVMLTKTASYVSLRGPDRGKPLVYIDFLEIAPWNWVIPGQFRTVGSTLFRRAVNQSEEEGFHGRVGLHALPQAESFYEKGCRMTPLGRDVNKQQLLYFELSRQQAERLLKEGET